MRAGVWCKAVLDQAKEEVGAERAQLVLFNRQSASFTSKYGDIDEETISRLEATSKRAIYDNDSKRKRLGDDIYRLFPISTRVGCIGVLIFQTTLGPEGLDLQRKHETSAQEAASIVGKIMIDDLFDKLGPMGQDIHHKESASENFLPHGYHSCVLVFVDLRSLSRLLGSANERPKVYEMIKEFNQAISNQTQRHYGVVNKYIGAGALLLFNLTVDDDVINEYRNIAALRALCAAAAIQERFQEIEQDYREILFETMSAREAKKIFKDIDIGVGMNADQPYLYPIGTADRFDYSCFGSAVSLAKSIESISGRPHAQDTNWDQPGYCSIMFSASVESQLRNLAGSEQFGEEIDIEFIQGPKDVTFDRFPNGYDLQTFARIRIDEPNIEPKLPKRIRNSIIYHEPEIDSINGNDYERWEIQIK